MSEALDTLGDTSPVGDSAQPTPDSSPDWAGLTEGFDAPSDDGPSDDSGSVLESSKPAEKSKPQDTTKAKPPSEPATAAPTTPEPTPPPAQPTTPATPEAPVPPPAPPVPEPQAPYPQAAQASPEQLAAARKQWVETTAQRYRLSPEDEIKLSTSPNDVLPMVAAELHAAVMEQTLQVVGQMMEANFPRMIDAHLTGRERSKVGSDVFFGQWPELKEHEARVLPIAQMYRTMNPQASREQFLRDVGVQAWMALNLDMAQLATKLSPGLATPPQQRVQTPGYSPAPSSTRPVPGMPSPPSNVFTELVNQWDLDNL